jgi:hypothetical protein
MVILKKLKCFIRFKACKLNFHAYCYDNLNFMILLYDEDFYKPNILKFSDFFKFFNYDLNSK